VKQNYIEKIVLKKFCEKHHIVKFAFFGSILRDDFNDNSDIDVLVEFADGHIPGFFGLFEIEDEFTKLLGGRKADIRTPQDLSRYFRDEVLSTMDVEYEAR
jgi:predicted nucleotidyltransferase